MQKDGRYTVYICGIILIAALFVCESSHAAPSIGRQETPSLYEQGIALYLEERYQESVEHFETYLKKNPDDKAAKEWVELIRTLIPSVSADLPAESGSSRSDETFEKMIAKYEHQYTSLRKEKELLNSTLQQQKQIQLQLQDKLENTEKALEQSRRNFEIAEAEYEQRIADMSMELTAQSSHLQSNNAALKKEIRILQGSIQKVRDDNSRQKNELTDTASELAKTQQQLAEALRDAAVRTEEARHSNLTAEALTQELHKVNAEKENVIQQKIREIADQNAELIRSLQNRLDGKEKELADLKVELNRSHSAIAELEVESQKIKTSFRRAQSLHSKINSIEEKADQESAALLKQKAETESKLKNLNLDIKAVERKYSDEKLSNLKQELNAVLSELNQQ
ncbi:MAG: hypothetical protein KC649_01185 [Candidatus Omnitrophica bacterium]|nr:hypothetical protein [Candidatus Omnitrophota bacterium]